MANIGFSFLEEIHCRTLGIRFVSGRGGPPFRMSQPSTDSLEIGVAGGEPIQFEQVAVLYSACRSGTKQGDRALPRMQVAVLSSACRSRDVLEDRSQHGPRRGINPLPPPPDQADDVLDASPAPPGKNKIQTVQEFPNNEKKIAAR